MNKIMYYCRYQKKKGFTLVEILVVLSIIGLLSAVVLFSVSQARGKARDSRRLTDLKQLEESLEYYATVNGGYPSSLEQYNTSADFNLTGVLDPEYIGEIPSDPSGDTYTYGTIGYSTTGAIKNGYILMAKLESYSDYPRCYIVGGNYPVPSLSPDPETGWTWPGGQYGDDIVGNDCHGLMR